MFSTLPTLPRSYQLPYLPYFMFSFFLSLTFKKCPGKQKSKLTRKIGETEWREGVQGEMGGIAGPLGVNLAQ